MNPTPSPTPYRYVGDELDVFSLATNWKSYYRSRLAPHLRGDVLEVGAGIGSTTRVLCTDTPRSWLCLEPDPHLADRLCQSLSDQPLPIPADIRVGTLADLGPERRFDTILYIDVLEHISDDRSELEQAASRLRPGGDLVVLCPAHNALFTEFDRAIGHFRRYNRAMLRSLHPPGTQLTRLFYLDSLGLLLSLGNRLLLRSGSPTPGQVLTWDRLFVPGSRLLDRFLGYRLGKSVVAIWRAPSS